MYMALPGEYNPYYATYINYVTENPLLLLSRQADTFKALFGAMAEEQGSFRYAEGKWSIKEVLGHIIDTERIFAYRALCIARGEQQPLPGYEQDEYVAAANFNNRDMQSLLVEFLGMRAANIMLFASFTEQELTRVGTASGNPFTVRALICICAGHTEHHLKVLHERYGL